jgi:hypothetical protein
MERKDAASGEDDMGNRRRSTVRAASICLLIRSNTTYSDSVRSEHLPLMLLHRCHSWPYKYVGHVDRP